MKRQPQLQRLTSPLPLYAAWCSGVLPDLSATSRLHTCGSKARAHPVAHLETAKCNGVCQNLSRALTSALCLSRRATAFLKKKNTKNKRKNNKKKSNPPPLSWNSLTSFCEVAARCKGVSKPWSLALTLAPIEQLQTCINLLYPTCLTQFRHTAHIMSICATWPFGDKCLVYS